MNRLFYHLALAIALLFVASDRLSAQYAMDALRLSKQVPSFDPHSMALGGSSGAQFHGFGSFLVNPATVSLVPDSYFSIGLGIREVSQESDFLGQNVSFDQNQTGLTHLGFAYSFPTITGSLVFGGGFSQTADYNSAFKINAYNNLSSRTYQFLTDYANDIAFNTFALDQGPEGLMSVFEFGGFMGVDQYAETTRRGQSGEYSLFLGTEFQKDLHLGVSVGIPVSSSEFRQIFIEEAPFDNNGQRLYTGLAGSGTFNIDRVLFEEKVSVDAVGLNARLGFIYTGLPWVDAGISYTTRTRWSVEERLDAFLQTRFTDVVTFDGLVMEDDGQTFGPQISDDLRGEYSYSARTPSRIHISAASKQLPHVDVSLAAERIQYSNIRLSGFDIADRDLEIAENNVIDESFNDVWNLRAGLRVTMFSSIEPRFGYARMQNPVNYIPDNVRQYLSGGVGIGINQAMSIDFALQYGFWNTTEDLYYVDASTGLFEDSATGAPVTFIETTGLSMDRIHAMFGINIRF